VAQSGEFAAPAAALGRKNNADFKTAMKKILFLLKDYQSYAEVFSEYLGIFHGHGIQTKVVDLTFVHARSKGFGYALHLFKEIKSFRPDAIYIGDELFSKNALLIVLIKTIFFYDYNISVLAASQYIPKATLSHALMLRFLLSHIHTLFCRNDAELKIVQGLPSFRSYHGLRRLYLGVPESFFHAMNQSKHELAQSLGLNASSEFWNGKYVLGFAGRMVPEKGLLLLLQALLQLPDSVILVAARRSDNHSTEYAAKVDQFIQENQMQDRVVWTADLRGQAVARLYNLCDLMVMPTTSQYDGFTELFGSVIAESMLCKTPVAGSDNGSIPEVIANPAGIFKQGDVQDMVRVINSSMNMTNSELGDLIEKNYQRAKEFYSDIAFANTIISALS
jgi:glycosyltransferase involved in cell wall biosynthesis